MQKYESVSINGEAVGNLGCGEALGSLSIISKMEIMSKIKYTEITYLKDFSTNKIYKISSPVIQNCGTIVNLCDLFYNIPVRRKSLRPQIEIIKIKEFLQKISMIHHDISFKLVDVSNDKIIWEQPSDLSVASRFSTYHGISILKNTKEVHTSVLYYSISGFLSPPIPSNCHWTKEYQYSFINNKFIKIGDIITNTINNIYADILNIENRIRGPSAKHYNSIRN